MVVRNNLFWWVHLLSVSLFDFGINKTLHRCKRMCFVSVLLDQRVLEQVAACKCIFANLALGSHNNLCIFNRVSVCGLAVCPTTCGSFQVVQTSMLVTRVQTFQHMWCVCVGNDMLPR
jgi:hypothetical protein